ncbi:hypothetical protein BDV37DRAFT_279120 [Aspergillus pseudonomiae]|uniref:Uncharacterized protein n=1 Tax=Aspergillus pseudonomiae TaxID=1506151 RepID=A0A5N7DNX6_9EURO|nr:uncharacterized protein BDV37DRAFT_279120 [Aspergillus pseudonomiae]KAE8408171.1 hypothetical protein BDV37DRAFT_279120 [Aspergillus pseudonomiae]
MSDKSWTEEFFFEWPPPEWINAVYDDRQVFRPFSPPQGKWVLGRSVGTGRRPSQDQIQVLWLLVQRDGMYMRKYVAKVFPDYTEENAYSQLRRVPPRIPKKLQEVKDELDPYTNEARAKACITTKLDITHGDVRDDHFRLPGDFHDTVLYDFSVSYTFSPVTPYLINFRRPRSLKDISESEQAMVREDIIERAEKLDIREYLVKSTKSTESAIMDALFQPLEDEILELIILRVKFRPDVFSMPSVNSVFPFLEGLCPTDDCTWHIRRGRLLESYTPIWVMSITDSSGQTVMDFTFDRDFAQRREEAKVKYLLCLIPKKWGVEDVRSPLVSICSSLPRNDHGCIKTWLDFNNYI